MGPILSKASRKDCHSIVREGEPLEVAAQNVWHGRRPPQLPGVEIHRQARTQPVGSSRRSAKWRLAALVGDKRACKHRAAKTASRLRKSRDSSRRLYTWRGSSPTSTPQAARAFTSNTTPPALMCVCAHSGRSCPEQSSALTCLTNPGKHNSRQ